MADTTTLPFVLTREHKETLAQSHGFMLLRQHLAQSLADQSLCAHHTSTIPPTDIPSWLLIRDILYALLVPIIELYDKAAQLSALTRRTVPATPPTTPDETIPSSPTPDLSSPITACAFTSRAASAYHTLHALLSAPQTRSAAHGRLCPACATTHLMTSAPRRRLLRAACLLSDVHYPFTIDAPTLPSFMFFVDLLARDHSEAAAADDDDDDDDDVGAKAAVEQLRDGVEELVGQCLALDAAVKRAPPSPVMEARLWRAEKRGVTVEVVERADMMRG